MTAKVAANRGKKLILFFSPIGCNFRSHQPPVVCAEDRLPRCYCEWAYTCCHSSPWVPPRTSVTEHANAQSTVTARRCWIMCDIPQSLDTSLRAAHSLCSINNSAYGFRRPHGQYAAGRNESSCKMRVVHVLLSLIHTVIISKCRSLLCYYTCERVIVFVVTPLSPPCCQLNYA